MPKYVVTKTIEKGLRQIANQLRAIPLFQIRNPGMSDEELIFSFEKVWMWGHEAIAAGVKDDEMGNPVKPDVYYVFTKRRTINHKRRMLDAYKDGGDDGVKVYLQQAHDMLAKVIEWDERQRKRKAGNDKKKPLTEEELDKENEKVKQEIKQLELDRMNAQNRYKELTKRNPRIKGH